MPKKTVCFCSPGSCKYPDIEAFHVFQTRKTDECHFCQLLPAHTLIQTHSHTNTGSDQRRGSTNSCFILAASTKRRVNAQKWRTGRWNFPGRSQSGPGSTQTFFRVTHARDSIDARVGGACVLNINRQRQRCSRVLLLDENG